MNRVTVKNPGFWALFAGLLYAGCWLGSWAQPGSSSVEIYDPALERSSGYYGEFPGRARRPEQQQQEVRVLVKEGKKIYCAWSAQLLDNDVTFKEVTPEEAGRYYDDGTHNDEIPFDGLPSSVLVNNNQYLSPYGWSIKERMEELRDKMLTLETSEQFKVAMWDKLDKWDPLVFYAGLHVTSLDAKTDLPRFVDKLGDLSDYGDIFDQDYIGQFRGLEYYPDTENPQWERALWSKREPQAKVIRKEMGLDRRQQLMDQQMYDPFGPMGSMGPMGPMGPGGPQMF
jgi:hypothetical protein